MQNIKIKHYLCLHSHLDMFMYNLSLYLSLSWSICLPACLSFGSYHSITQLAIASKTLLSTIFQGLENSKFGVERYLLWHVSDQTPWHFMAGAAGLSPQHLEAASVYKEPPNL